MPRHEKVQETLGQFTEGRFRFFPKPFAEELLFSVVARFYLLTQPPSTWTTTLASLVDRERWEVTGAYLPGGIGNIAKRMPESHVLADPHGAAIHHTALNYCTYFQSPAHRTEAVANMIEDLSISQLYFFVGMRVSPMAGPRPLLFCSACAKEDFQSVGTPYWHTPHQLPGVFVCWKHGTQLLQGCLHCHGSFNDKDDPRLPPLHPCRIAEHTTRRFPIPFLAKGDWLQRLAIEARAMSQNTDGFPVHWQKSVRLALMDDGFRRGSLFTCRKVTEALDAQYGADMVSWCKFVRTTDTSKILSTVGRMMSLSNYRFNSFKQLMLTLLLGDSLTQVEERLRQFRGAPWEDQEASEADSSLKRGRYGIATAQKYVPPGETSRTVEDLRSWIRSAQKDPGACGNWRVVRAMPDEIESLRVEFPDFLDAYLELIWQDQREAYRREVSEAIAKRRYATRRYINRTLAAEAAWLQKHDSVWYDAQFPAQKIEVRSIIDRLGRYDQVADRQAALRIKATVADLMKDPSSRQRTRALMMRFAEVPSGVRFAPELWPITLQALDWSVESKEQFADRRIQTALEDLAKEKRAIYLNDLNHFYQVPAAFKATIRERLIRECPKYGLEFLQQ